MVSTNLSPRYDQVCWVLQIETLENTHRIFFFFFCFLLFKRENKINYQVNMNHYLYPNGYYPLTGTDGELQHFVIHKI